jgi:hypothetical protein
MKCWTLAVYILTQHTDLYTAHLGSHAGSSSAVLPAHSVLTARSTHPVTFVLRPRDASHLARLSNAPNRLRRIAHCLQPSIFMSSDI